MAPWTSAFLVLLGSIVVFLQGCFTSSNDPSLRSRDKRESSGPESGGIGDNSDILGIGNYSDILGGGEIVEGADILGSDDILEGGGNRFCADGCDPSWLGDGICDDYCNNEQCRWDINDCSVFCFAVITLDGKGACPACEGKDGMPCQTFDQIGVCARGKCEKQQPITAITMTSTTSTTASTARTAAAAMSAGGNA